MKLPKFKIPKIEYRIVVEWYRPAKKMYDYLVEKGFYSHGTKVTSRWKFSGAVFYLVPLSVKETIQVQLKIGELNAWDGEIKLEQKGIDY